MEERYWAVLSGRWAITLTTYKIAPIITGMNMDIAAMLGKTLGGWTMRMIMHFANGTIIFPLFYVYLLFCLRWTGASPGMIRSVPGEPVLRGIIWGVVLWLLAQVIVMPMMGAGVFSSKMGGGIAAMGSLIPHVIYGALLGWIAGPQKEGFPAGQPLGSSSRSSE